MLKLNNSKYLTRVLLNYSFNKSPVTIKPITATTKITNNQQQQQQQQHQIKPSFSNNLFTTNQFSLKNNYCTTNNSNNSSNNNNNLTDTEPNKESLEYLRKLIRDQKNNKNKNEDSIDTLSKLEEDELDRKIDSIDSIEDLDSNLLGSEYNFDISEELDKIESLLKSEFQLESIEDLEKNELDTKEIKELQKKKELEQQKYQELYDKIKMETNFEIQVTDTARKAYRTLLNDTSVIRRSTGLQSIKNVMYQWYDPLIKHTTQEIRRLQEENAEQLLEEQEMQEKKSKEATADSATDSPLLKVPSDIEVLTRLPIKKLCLISLNQMVSELLSDPERGTVVGTAVESIGETIMAEYQMQLLKKYDRVQYKRLMKPFNGAVVTVRSIQNYMRRAHNNLERETIMVNKIGSFMLKSIMDSCFINKYKDGEDIDEKVPAFYYKYRYFQNKKYGVIMCHENVYSLFDEGHFLVEAMNARLLPMVIPPQPWTAPNKGCYIQYPSFIMRTNGSKLQKTSLFQTDLTNIYEGLNVLGEVPWKTNPKMLSILLEAWETGGGVADLPSRYDFEIPEAPTNQSSPDNSEENEKLKKEYNKKVRKIKRANGDLHSLRCDTLYKLNVAKQLQDYTFYFPHNIDFRGRSYPIPPHLNHMGSDFCRSMLKFSDEKELGARGFEWLKVQVANLYGVDKVSFEDRVAFTMDNLDNIFDSADNPLKGNRWWLKADSPWQTLAACIELTDAIRSGSPETFKSSLPIHQDGTCNGLQHYAALGGDELGALKVNLLPSPKPQDVYTGVAQMVAQIVHEDALAGDELAKLLDGKIERKIIKQTVMTSVYGVTFVGARLQIENALSDKYQIEDATLFKATSYLSKLTFASLDKMFIGARSIMAWLAHCAGTISKETGECVAWYTPLGLPVVQPYRKGGKLSVKTIINDYLMVEDNDDLPVDSRKQRSAFPPNFIHSLDSTHMFLTAIQCKKKGITFASVHDSFWTHASTIDSMNTLLRHQFVELHSQPILDRLREWFVHRYPNVNIPPVPSRGSLDLKKVRDSKYFFH